MSSTTSHTTLPQRYPGVKPFTTEDRATFFGRAHDTEALFDLVWVKQVVVLYGKSGFGKSSLLQAGLVPALLESNAYVPLPIRFRAFNTQEANASIAPLDTLKASLKELLPAEGLDSPMGQITQNDDSLWHWLKTLQWHQKSCILLIDQFEELFTYADHDRQAFSEQLAEALYSTLPNRYQRRLNQLDEAGDLDDAFHDFLYQKPDLKILFSIRTDRLALLNQLTDHHPGILQHCYELALLNTAQAEEALTRPAALTQHEYASPPFEYAPEALSKIMDSITKDGQVGLASILQIVGWDVETRLVMKQDKRRIEADDLGDMKDIFKKKYEDILQNLIPSDRDKAQWLIEEQLISGQLRNPLSEAYIRDKKPDISNALLKTLEDSSLLRKERDASGRLLYEVSHDTLVEPIQQVAQARLAVEAVEKQKALEAEIEAEKERNAKLNRLTWLAWGVSIVAILIALAAGYAWREAEKAKLRAEKEKARADENLEVAQQFLDDLTLKEVDKLETVAQSFLEYKEFQLALDKLKEAKNRLDYRGQVNSLEEETYIVLQFPDDDSTSLAKSKNPKIEQRLKTLKNKIEKYQKLLQSQKK